MATTKTKIADDAGSNNWLKERAAICKRQKTDPAVARLIEKADQLHKERTQKHLQEETIDDEANDEVPEPNAEIKTPRKMKNSFRRSLLPSPLNYSKSAEEDEEEDIDAIVSVPPPEEIVVKVAPKSVEETPVSNHTKESTEEILRSFAESVLEQGLTTDSSLELSFDLKPEDIKVHESAELVCAEQESVEQENMDQESVEQESTDQENVYYINQTNFSSKDVYYINQTNFF
ncbi:2347_t:CDS:2 [Racocetra fulgida]|uniref:2347_t:CDS:1 n=1 Tax=Racocetra fulgida TaxID=60492 RepID=A0A9N9FVE8_9GLOM|nr:2347_t:CDS:2 [Racocetra fulgida]